MGTRSGAASTYQRPINGGHMPLDSLPILQLFGITSGLLSGAAFMPYIRDVVRGRTQPKRAAWLIWSVISLISFVSLIDEGATASLWFVGTQSLGTASIFALSIGLGRGDYLSRKDIGVLAGAALGVALWQATDEPGLALAMNIAASSLGGFAMIGKAYRSPDTETLSTWILFALSAALSVASVGSLAWVELAYPVYLLTLYLAIILAILTGSSPSLARS